MKIDLITYSAAVNYGAILQTYSLYVFLKKLGYEVEIINYIQDRYDFENPNYGNMCIERFNFWKKNNVTKFIWKNTYLKNIIKNSLVFRDFLHKYVKMTKKYYSIEELKSDVPKADLYITGSDQVWNSDYTWNGKIDLPYYLSFLNDDQKRISYASSFGKENISEIESLQIKPLLEKYSKISVREEKAKEIVNKLGLKSKVVCDPTILCDSSVYDKIIGGLEIKEKNYILLFMIGFDKKLYKLAKKLSKENGKKLIIILPDSNDRKKCYKNVYVTPSIEKWLFLFKTADYIITNSFHGTIFSILFFKKFSSSLIVNNNGRIVNILKKTNLMNRGLHNHSFEELRRQYNLEIDYFNVNNAIAKIRKESQDWLRAAIEEALE